MFLKGTREQQREGGIAQPRNISSRLCLTVCHVLKMIYHLRGEFSGEDTDSHNRIAIHCLHRLPNSPGTMSSVGKSEVTQLACWWLTSKGVFFGTLNGWLHCLHGNGVCGPFYFLQHPQIHPLPTAPQQGTTQPYLIPWVFRPL